MPDQIMEDPQTIAVHNSLGRLREEYRPSLWRTAYLPFVGLIICTVLFLSMLQTPMEITTILILCIFILIIFLCIRSVYRASKRRDTYIQLYDNGLFYRGHEGLLTIRWDEITEVAHEVHIERRRNYSSPNQIPTTTTIRTHRYTVRCFEGTYLKLDETFADLHRLGKTIEQQSAQSLLPQALKSLLANNPLPFGAFTITMTGLYKGNILLPWSEFKKVDIDEYNGTVTIRQHGHLFNWASVPLAEVPNIELFTALIHKLQTP